MSTVTQFTQSGLSNWAQRAGVLFSRPGSLIVLMIGMIAATNLFAQPDTLWTKTFGGISGDVSHAVQQTTDNGFIITGGTYSYGAGIQDIWLIKTDALGDTLWTKTFGGTNGEWGGDVQQTADGGYIITGDGYSTAWLIKTDSLGDTLWVKTFGGFGGSSVQQTTDGGYIVGGRRIGYWSNDVWIMKTDSLGDTLWTRVFGGENNDESTYIQQTTDGGYITVAYTYSYGAGLHDVWLIKTDSLGDTLWTKTFGGNNEDQGMSGQQTTDGGYIITGSTQSFGAGGDVWLIKTNSSGDTLWTKTFGKLHYDCGYSVQQTVDGGYIITGMTQYYAPPDVWIIRTDSLGDTLWTRTIGGSDTDFCFDVQQTTDGGYVTVGLTYSYGAGEYDAYVIRVGPEPAPAFSVLPDSIDFGEVYVDSSRTDSVTVTNTGTAPLDIFSVISDSSQFTVTPTTGSLAPDSSMEFYITFTPVDTVTVTVVIIFTHNAASSPDTIIAAGTGVPEPVPAFSIAPDSIDFGAVYIDSSQIDSVTVTNTGTATLDIFSVISESNQFTVIPTTGSLAPDASMEFYITFAPTDTGTVTANIIFTHNAASSPDTVSVTGNGIELGIDEITDGVIPASYALSQSHPNPFKTGTDIQYQLPEPGFVTVVIYNVSGQRMMTLVKEYKDAGYYTAHWNGSNQNSQTVSNGVYFCRMKVGEYIAVKKLLLMR